MRSNLRHPGSTTAISDNNADHVSRGSLGGTDFKDGYGTPVHAQLDGVVTIVDNSPAGSGGRYSRVTGNDGGGSVESLHQSSVTAYRGMPTNPETVVGISGASAYGSNYGTGGPHIHNHGVPMRNLEPYYWFLNGGTVSPAIGGNATAIPELTPEQIDEKEIDMTTGQILDGQRDWASYLNNGIAGRLDNEISPLLRIIAKAVSDDDADIDALIEAQKVPFYQIKPSGRGAAIDVAEGFVKTYGSWQEWQNDVRLGVTSGKVIGVTETEFNDLLARAKTRLGELTSSLTPPTA